MIAFAMDHFDSGIKNDERYIKWVYTFSHSVDNVVSRTYYPVHKCTE